MDNSIESEFREYWLRNFGQVPYLGYLLKEYFCGRWLRIHYLPEAKRYAESPEEQEEIRRVQNMTLEKHLGPGTEFWLLLTMWKEEADYPKLLSGMLDGAIKLQDPITLDETEDADYFLKKMQWQSGMLDDLLAMIAEDKFSNVLIVHASVPRIIYPYDGGLDVILEL